VAVVWYLGVSAISENALFGSITALSLLIALYYTLTGIPCTLCFRRRLTRSLRDLLLVGVGPLVGAGLLLWLLVLSVLDPADPANSYTGAAWLRFGPSGPASRTPTLRSTDLRPDMDLGRQDI